jgi:hypothetical protein
MTASAAGTRKRLLLLGLLVALGFVAFFALFTRTIASKQTEYFQDVAKPDVRTATSYHRVSGGDRELKKEAEWRELRASAGHWVKDGPCVRWSATGAKLEEGSYADGKRQGPWTFWDEKGIVDSSSSGKYENDVRTEPASSPKGDFGDGE